MSDEPQRGAYLHERYRVPQASDVPAYRSGARAPAEQRRSSPGTPATPRAGGSFADVVSRDDARRPGRGASSREASADEVVNTAGLQGRRTPAFSTPQPSHQQQMLRSEMWLANARSRQPSAASTPSSSGHQSGSAQGKGSATPKGGASRGAQGSGPRPWERGAHSRGPSGAPRR